ncbi:hypothetical protein KUC_0115 [Vreelandella boliviensis LC1]|uniref:Uncharacterized protein n=1 Tax=Vreelandella boliviensis LC1 TaxID=1072583 RepID=A0A7U9C0Z3_9GAMM|nr:hypothetical protein KUC_0115 [Halomonas boliviensis LC1]
MVEKAIWALSAIGRDADATLVVALLLLLSPSTIIKAR